MILTKETPSEMNTLHISRIFSVSSNSSFSSFIIWGLSCISTNYLADKDQLSGLSKVLTMNLACGVSLVTSDVTPSQELWVHDELNTRHSDAP
jgi:hypothetical protein